MSNVMCIGSELRLVDCRRSLLSERSCNHASDAGVRCYERTGQRLHRQLQFLCGLLLFFVVVCCCLMIMKVSCNLFLCLDCIHGDIRLASVHGNLLQGRVEMCYDGVWGTVCSNNWEEVEASVVCRQLGFSSSGTCELSIICLLHVRG